MLRHLTFIFPIFIFSLQTNGQIFDAGNTDKMALEESKHFLQKAAFYETENAAETDFIYQRMEWDIDPNVRYISGKITTLFICKTSSLSQIYFDLNDDMEVDSVCQRGHQLNFNRDSNQVIVNLANYLTENQLDSVSVYYHGIPAETGYGSFTKSTHGNESVPIIWTLSEPYGAMDWWPCKQSLNDKIDSIDIIVSSPEDYRTASNGILVSEKVESGKRIMHWKHRFPIATYLVAISVTNYVNYSDFVELEDGRKIEILNYVYPESENDAKNITTQSIKIMELYNELVGEYPFASEKYGHAQFGWHGGMEHQTMSFMGYFSFGLIAHEMAHQWFGDYITLGSWQDIWLNEGFATYLTGLTYENIDTYWWPLWKKARVDQITSEPGGSVYVSDTTDISRIFSSRLSYSKGAYLLHMLRWIIGDEAFFSAIRSYFEDPEVANGFARTSQLIKHFETAGDTTLTEFFNDWFYGEGYPVYSLNYIQPANDSLIIELSQTSSSSSVDFFEIPVPVRLYNSDKSDSLDLRLNQTTNNQVFIVDPGFEVDQVTIDPDYWLICKTASITDVVVQTEYSNILVYPNPVSDQLTISVPSGDRLIKTQLFSPNGKLISSFGENYTNIDLSKLQAGTYILVFQTSSGEFRKKIIKM